MPAPPFGVSMSSTTNPDAAPVRIPTFAAGQQRPVLRHGKLALTSSRLVTGTVTAEVARQQADGTWLWATYLVLNPMADIVIGFQRAIYGDVCPPAVKTATGGECQLVQASVGWEAQR